MIFKIQHSTSYTYSRPVCLDPHLLRLRPRADGSLRMIRFSQQIRPQPAGMTEFTDLEGNAAADAWFEGTTTNLTITTDMQIETLRTNAFDFIITEPELTSLPARYSDPIELTLGVYCQPLRVNGPVFEFADRVAQECAGRTVDFLLRLAQTIRNQCKYEVRETGPAQSPEVTLDLQSGSCRDLTQLYVESCRTQGLAARFASGYVYGNGFGVRHELHAWAEVYLPGAGWRGFDPTLGIATADHHVLLASSLTPSGAAPVTGLYWGSDVIATIKARVHIEPVSEH